MPDILLKTDDVCFSYRVGAIIVQNNNVLMVKNENYPYYYSVGGGVQFGENSENAVLREIYEELNINLEIDILAFIHENFFISDFMNDAFFHELRLFYLMKIDDDIDSIVCNSKGADGGNEALHWLPINKLSDYQLYPEFYKTELQNLTNEVKHFITKNEVTIRAV